MQYSMHAVACPSTSTAAQLSLPRASALTAVAALQLGNINKPTGYNATSSGLQNVSKWLKFSGQVRSMRNLNQIWSCELRSCSCELLCQDLHHLGPTVCMVSGQTLHECYHLGKHSPLVERRVLSSKIQKHPTFRSVMRLGACL